MTLGKCCHICKRVICFGLQRIVIKRAQSIRYLSQIGLNSPICLLCFTTELLVKQQFTSYSTGMNL